MQLPSGSVHVVRLFGVVESEQLQTQLASVLCLDPSLRSGSEESLDAPVPEAFYHYVQCNDTSYIGSNGKSQVSVSRYICLVCYSIRNLCPKPASPSYSEMGGSQTVRLPREFSFDGDRVRITQVAQFPDIAHWFAEMDRLNSGPLMPGDRKQPATPKRGIFK